MLSIVIKADTGGERLANTLAALVPAVAQGIVKDGWIITRCQDADTDTIADAAGCECLKGERALAEAVHRANGDWVMFLLAGVSPGEGWWSEVADFMKRSGDGRRCSAAFTLADPRYEWSGRLAEWLSWARHLATGRPNALQGLLAPRQLLVEQTQMLTDEKFPPRTSGRTALLRTRLMGPDPGAVSL